MIEHFTAAVFLATLNSKFVDILKQPILQWKPEANLWWFSYISLVTGFLLAWFAQIRLMSNYIAEPTVDLVVSGLLIGAGSWFLYEVFIDKPDTVSVKTTTEPGQGADTRISVSQTKPEAEEEEFTWTR